MNDYLHDDDPNDYQQPVGFVTNTQTDPTILIRAASEVGVSIRLLPAHDCRGRSLNSHKALCVDDRRCDLTAFWKQVDLLELRKKP